MQHHHQEHWQYIIGWHSYPNQSRPCILVHMYSWNWSATDLKKGKLDWFSTGCILLAPQESSEWDNRSENICIVFIMQTLSRLSVVHGSASTHRVDSRLESREGAQVRWDVTQVDTTHAMLSILIEYGSSKYYSYNYNLLASCSSLLIEHYITKSKADCMYTKHLVNNSESLVIWVRCKGITRICTQDVHTVQLLLKQSYLLWWAFVSGYHGGN